jgi:tritrans,polycis-undecaprenyl-diphosphate synthase [geranylgeranyl-diphosphate specific]
MENNYPTHIAIILDGNRRFAKSKMLEPWKGHELGSTAVENLFEYSRELKIKQLTLYCLSTENLKRDKKEVDYLIDLMKRQFEKMSQPEEFEKIEKNKVKIRFIGNLDLLPRDLKKICLDLEFKTSENSNYIINFALAYGGRQEIMQAIKNIIREGTLPEEITEELIQENLYLTEEPDIIIRTGGEKRISNFLPWQSTYSELFFLDKLWPEFNKNDMAQVIEQFKNRKRNFGK